MPLSTDPSIFVALANWWANTPGKVRRRQQIKAEAYLQVGLTDADVHELARYNGERSRGVQHTPEWVAKMAILQGKFNAAWRLINEREGIIVLEDQP